MKRKVIQIDAETGEQLEDGYLAYVAPKRSNGFYEGWLAMSQQALLQLATAGFTGEQLRVLLALLAYLDFENYAVINQAEIGRQLGITKNAVNRSLRVLIEKGVIIKEQRVGVNVYRLNPEYGWKGDARRHIIALDEYRRKAATVKDRSVSPSPSPSSTDATVCGEGGDAPTTTDGSVSPSS